MAKELTKEALLDELEQEMEFCFNRLAKYVIKDLSTSIQQGGVSPTLTGFYASSWKASKSPIVFNERVENNSPWSTAKASYLATGVRPAWKIKQRHVIPKFSLYETMYIANTVEYSPAAFALSRVPQYATSGILKSIEKAFSDSDRAILSYKANVD